MVSGYEGFHFRVVRSEPTAERQAAYGVDDRDGQCFAWIHGIAEGGSHVWNQMRHFLQDGSLRYGTTGTPRAVKYKKRGWVLKQFYYIMWIIYLYCLQTGDAHCFFINNIIFSHSRSAHRSLQIAFQKSCILLKEPFLKTAYINFWQ